MGGMKNKILIIGEPNQTTFVELNHLLKDEQNRAWLNFCLDNKTILADNIKNQFFELSSLTKLLKLFDFDIITNSKNLINRQITIVSDNQLKTIKDSQNNDYLWPNDINQVNYILVLKSAYLSDSIINQIIDLKKQQSQIKLVVEAQNGQLVSLADLVFVDASGFDQKYSFNRIIDLKTNKLAAVINHQNIYLSNGRQVYNFNRINNSVLKTTVWLAIIIASLDYQLELDQRMNLIGRMAAEVIKLRMPKLDEINQNSIDNQVNLIAGSLDQKQIIKKLKQLLMSKNVLNLSNLNQIKNPATKTIINNLLQTKGLNQSLSSVIFNQSQLNQLDQSLIDSSLVIGISIDNSMMKLKDSQIINQFKTIKRQGIKLVFCQTNFKISQNNLTEQQIITKVYQLTHFVKMAQKTSLLPIIKLSFTTDLTDNFDLESALNKQQIIIKALINQLELAKVDIDNLVLELGLLENQGLLLNSQRLEQQLTSLNQNPILKNVSLIIGSDNFDWDQLKLFNQKISQKHYNVSLDNQSIAQLLKNWQADQKQDQVRFRIEFSILLSQIS